MPRQKIPVIAPQVQPDLWMCVTAMGGGVGRKLLGDNDMVTKVRLRTRCLHCQIEKTKLHEKVTRDIQ